MPKITTEFVHPPIPIRTMDWAAIRDDYDVGDPVGMGPTELAAISDLIEKEQDLEN